MARPVWNGALSLGLVTVPVALYTATRDHSVPFRQIERGTADRIRMRRVNERTGKEVDYSDVAKGYQTGGDEIVEVEPEELAEIAPGRSRSLDIERFVDLADIDPIHYDKTYWLAPKNPDYAHAYHLLRTAMADTGLAGIAMLVMRGRQHLTAVRAGEGILVLHTMRFADEIRDWRKELRDFPKADKARPKELDMATDLVRAMSAPWKPESYADTYQEQVRDLVHTKESGRKPKKSTGPAEPTNVVDLTEALQRSMRQASGRGGGKRATRQPDPASMSKAELDALARELDVRGRSSMTKAELAAAVADRRSKRAS
ncbi:MAG TPA: Ku protein [Pseudonocardiaceae bacterium]|nr:Ku protein [Pseudonocardiaceae bacterium]